MEVRLAVIPYDAKVNHDGRLYSFPIPRLHVNKCDSCGDILFDNLTDDEISEALREHLHLLSPREIRDKLKILGLNQKEFGKRIGVAAETISRWLHGMHIQSRALDNLMRFFFELNIPTTTLPMIEMETDWSPGESCCLTVAKVTNVHNVPSSSDKYHSNSVPPDAAIVAEEIDAVKITDQQSLWENIESYFEPALTLTETNLATAA